MDDIVTELRAHRDIDNDRCIECGHWTDHDDNCMVGRAADEIERLRAEIVTLRTEIETLEARRVRP